VSFPIRVEGGLFRVVGAFPMIGSNSKRERIRN
jgi:hypothetical protein